MFKKLSILLIGLMVVLAGCSSTNPALKEVYLKNQQQENLSSITQVTFDTNLFDAAQMPLSKDEKLVVDLLKSGIIVEGSVENQDSTYFKLSFNDPDILKKSEYWNNDAEPTAEVFIDGYNILGKTSSEDKFINFIPKEVVEELSVTPEEEQKYTVTIEKLLTEYVEQFDYKLNDINYIGKETIQTPEGNKQARHIQVKMDIAELQQFLSYTLGNLAKSNIIEGYFTSTNALFANESEQFVDEIPSLVEDTRNEILIMKQAVDEFDLDAFTEQQGFMLDALVTLDYYVEDSGLIVASDANINIEVTPTTDEELIDSPIFLNLDIASMFYNYNKVDLEVPSKEDTLDYYKLTTDYNELQKLSKTSFIRNEIEKDNHYYRPASGVLNIGSTKAIINNEEVTLNEAPFTQNGTTLVPIRTITDITGSDIEWKKEIKAVQFNYNSNNVYIKIGSRIAFVNGRSVNIPVAPIIKNGTTFVPIRFVTENLDAKVDYNKELKQIKIDF